MGYSCVPSFSSQEIRSGEAAAFLGTLLGRLRFQLQYRECFLLPAVRHKTACHQTQLATQFSERLMKFYLRCDGDGRKACGARCSDADKRPSAWLAPAQTRRTILQNGRLTPAGMNKVTATSSADDVFGRRQHQQLHLFRYNDRRRRCLQIMDYKHAVP